MKDWYVMVRTYNTYGGNGTLSLLSPFFLKDLPDFGPALQELTTTFHFASEGPSKTLEELYGRFHAERAKLPKVIFRRERESASIDFASDLTSGAGLKQNRECRLDWFTRGAREIVANLKLLRPRFKRTDDFDLNGFLAHCNERLKDLPFSQADFVGIVEQLELQEKIRRESLSAWDRLGLDFRDFHPNARQILDDPFYWDVADDFAPNGNDTGADLLADYRDWLKRHSATDAPEFLDQTLQKWGLKATKTCAIRRLSVWPLQTLN